MVVGRFYLVKDFAGRGRWSAGVPKLSMRFILHFYVSTISTFSNVFRFYVFTKGLRRNAPNDFDFGSCYHYDHYQVHPLRGTQGRGTSEARPR